MAIQPITDVMPPIFVINLDRDLDRLEAVRNNLGALGLTFVRIPGVLGKDLPDWLKHVDKKAYGWRNRQDLPRAGEVGCYLSHLKAIETFLKTDAAWCVILEDDAQLLPDCREVLEALGGRSDWDVVKLFNFHSGFPVRRKRLTPKHDLVIHLARTTSAAAYALNRKAAEVLARTLLPMSEQLDHAHDRPWETGLRIRGVRPMPAALMPETSSASTIGYQDRHRSDRGLVKSARLFLSRTKKETLRLIHALLEAVKH